MIGAIYLVQSLQSCKFCRVNTQRNFSPSLILHCQYHFNVPLVTSSFFSRFWKFIKINYHVRRWHTTRYPSKKYIEFIFKYLQKKNQYLLITQKTGINKRLKREMKWKWNNEICIGRGKDSCIKRQCRPILMIIYILSL